MDNQQSEEDGGNVVAAAATIPEPTCYDPVHPQAFPIYHYDPATRLYLGKGLSGRDPLDPDNHLIPAHATPDAPPHANVVWGDNGWEEAPASSALPAPDAAAIAEVAEVPSPSPDQINARNAAELRRIARQVLDAGAQSKDYEDIEDMISYANEDAVPRFQEDGQRARRWRSLMRAYVDDAIAKGMAGSWPGAHEFVKGLPVFGDDVPIVISPPPSAPPENKEGPGVEHTPPKTHEEIEAEHAASLAERHALANPKGDEPPPAD
jgi:hypothetical protein